MPIVVLCVSAIAFAGCGLAMMQSVGEGDESVGMGLTASFAVFVLAALAVVIVEVRRVGHRFERPEHQMRLAMRRIRTGDVGFRVSLRRGEPLAGMAYECNELLDWLNVNPPAGVRTGGDIVDVDLDGDDNA